MDVARAVPVDNRVLADAIFVAVAVSVGTLSLLRLARRLGLVDEPQQVWVSSSEVGIRVLARTLVLPLAGSHGVIGQADLLVEAIHVQLADERGIVIVLEQLGDQGPGKLVFIQDDEGIAFVGPANEIDVFVLVQEASESQ